MPFLPPNQQRKSTEGTSTKKLFQATLKFTCHKDITYHNQDAPYHHQESQYAKAKNSLWYKVIQKQSNSSYPDAFLVIHSSDHFDTHLGNLGEIWLFYTDVTENFYDSFPDTNTGVLLKQQCNLQIHCHNFFVTTHKSKLTKRYTHLFLNTIISASQAVALRLLLFFQSHDITHISCVICSLRLTAKLHLKL